MVLSAGIEPATSALSGRRSRAGLSYDNMGLSTGFEPV